MAPRTSASSEFDPLNIKIELLSREWDLRLVTKEDWSPSKSKKTLRDECYSGIKLLHHKKRFDAALSRFTAEAKILYDGWVYKPRADKDVIPRAPKTRSTPRPVTDSERKQLLELLVRILREDIAKWKQETTPSPARFAASRAVDDTPVSFALSSHKPDSDPTKRPRDEAFSDLAVAFKKPRMPDPPKPPAPKSRQSFDTNSVDTSFASTSDVQGVFSRRQSLNSSMQPSTQQTIPEEPDLAPHTWAVKESFLNPQPDKAISTDYSCSSSFERRLAEVLQQPASPTVQTDILSDEGGLSQDLLTLDVTQGSDHIPVDPTSPGEPPLDPIQQEFRDGLHRIFSELPSSLRSASLRVIYEITRVFLHADVSLDDVDFPEPGFLDDYDTLWKFFRSLPALDGKSLPERCSDNVWDLASGKFCHGFRGIIFSGSLRFNASKNGQLFQFRLDPLKLDLSHRLSRRFGDDRFLEITIPDLTSRDVPDSLKLLGASGPEIVIRWLVSSRHPIAGRYWKPFFLKPVERKERNRNEDDETVAPAAHRFYFFAVDGIGLSESTSRPVISIDELLDSIRPTQENAHQAYLKLFTRTSLAVSRNQATITLEPDQIYLEDDIEYAGKVMTDGAGRMSMLLATSIQHKLGLSRPPSGFQGRIGGAKGFWSVAYKHERPGIWIEIRKSQCKWIPHVDDSHPSNRTFEVLRWSSPLKSADLNLQFLPLLVDQSKSPRKMQDALASLLKEGLDTKLLSLATAMDDPMSFRQWLRESNSNLGDKLKAGMVPYRACLPLTTEERLNMMLDAGFEAKKIHFMKNLALKAFENRCLDLQKRLNITVGKSTYAYMVPDFSEVLEPGEIFLDFTSFTDNISGLDGMMLDGVDVLIARSPAHYASDIQKVRAVFKLELIGLKDVVVFPTKGFPSLADKLSGGDYDGDIAWVCWEPSIVDNFQNAEVSWPLDPTPDTLVKEGFVRQDKTTYKKLVEGRSDPTSKFLEESFKFNMQQSMLGICTVFKENVSYTQSLQSKRNTDEVLWLSTLLSCLVDQSKQGYSFTEDDWNNFKLKKVKFTPLLPRYKNKDGHFQKNARHIIDQLMYVASQSIKGAVNAFHGRLQDPPRWDEDLVTFHRWAKEKAKTEPEWDALLRNLDEDIESIKGEWAGTVRKSIHLSRSFQASGGTDETKPEYMQRIDHCYTLFQTIRPRKDTPLSQSLLRDCFDIEVSDWALLRASALFHSYNRHRDGINRFVWFMAGKHLCRLKAYAVGSGFPPAITPAMYAMLKPDSQYVRRAKANEVVYDDNMSVANAEEIEDLKDD